MQRGAPLAPGRNITKLSPLDERASVQGAERNRTRNTHHEQHHLSRRSCRRGWSHPVICWAEVVSGTTTADHRKLHHHCGALRLRRSCKLLRCSSLSPSRVPTHLPHVTKHLRFFIRSNRRRISPCTKFLQMRNRRLGGSFVIHDPMGNFPGGTPTPRTFQQRHSDGQRAGSHASDRI